MCTHNVKTDFLKVLNKVNTPTCLVAARIIIGDLDGECTGKVTRKIPIIDAILPRGYTETEYKDFLEKIDIEFNTGGLGNPRIFGYIWFSQNIWAERVHVNGQEWWEIKDYPDITDHLDAPPTYFSDFY